MIATNDRQVKTFMISIAESLRDCITGEINCTNLAEQAALKFNLYNGLDYEIPEFVFDMALSVVERMGDK